mgnify:FL=1
MKKSLIIFIIISFTIFAFSGLISAQIYKNIEFEIGYSNSSEELQAGGTVTINENPKDKANITGKVYGLIPEHLYMLFGIDIDEVFTTSKSGTANIHYLHPSDTVWGYLFIINYDTGDIVLRIDSI